MQRGEMEIKENNEREKESLLGQNPFFHFKQRLLLVDNII
jgi:hypothetical protein